MEDVRKKVKKISSILEITMLRLSIVLLQNVSTSEMFSIGEKLVKEHFDEITDGGFWVWNHHTNEIYYSPKFCTTLGFDYGELGAGFSGFNRGNPAQMKTSLDNIQNLIDTKSHEAFTNTIEFTKKDGSIILIECSGAVVFIGDVPYIVLGTHKLKNSK